MHEDERMEYDERVDAALRRYAQAPHFSEPRVALARVRALAEQEPARPWWRVWAWALPSCALAALIGLLSMWVLRVPQAPQIAWTPKAPGVTSMEANSDLQTSGTEALNLSQRVAARLKSCPDTNRDGCKRGRMGTVTAARDLPKQEVFPTPQPLSPEERALVVLATQTPPDVTKQVIEAQQHLGDPIQIAALKIRPLDEDEGQTEPKGKEM